ncbi:2-oxoisovalerate dehydrogenase [Bacillus safensis FO-36b] [Bacillus safensis subsp. safensis]
MPVMSYIDAITLAMKEEMERDPKVFVLGEDVGKKGGVFKATAGLYEQFGEARVMDTPLAESAIAGVGIGAAMYGSRRNCRNAICGFHYACNQPNHFRGCKN